MKKINTKDIGIRLALAGVGTALSLVFVAMSYFLNFMTLSFTVLSCVGIMCPLSKGYYREGILSAIAVGAIGFFIVNIHIIPYAMISGLYVVITVFLEDKKVNKLLLFFIKFLYSCLIFYIVYKVTGLLVVNVSKISFLAKFNPVGLYIILNLIFALCFLAYDWLLIKGYYYAKDLANRLIKSRK